MTSTRSQFISSSFTAVALVIGASACQESPVNDLGYTSADLTQPDTALPEPEGAPAPPAPLPPVAQFALDFAGVWIGEAEDPLAYAGNADDEPPPFEFPSGSTLIRLELTDIGSPYPVGAITFGVGR